MLVSIDQGIPKLTFVDQNEANEIFELSLKLGLEDYYHNTPNGLNQLKTKILTTLSFPTSDLYVIMSRRYHIDSSIELIDKLSEYGLTIKFRRKYYYISVSDEFLKDLYQTLTAEQKSIYNQAMIVMIINIFDTSTPNGITISIPVKDTRDIHDFDFEFENAPLIALSDGVYKLKLEKTKISSLNRLKNFAINQTEQAFKLQLAVIENSYRDKIKELNKKIEELASQRFTYLIKNLKDLVDNGWKILDNGVFYSGIVYADKVIASDSGIAVALPIPQTYRIFYISGVFIPYNSNVDATYAIAAFHPNVSQGNVMNTFGLYYGFNLGSVNMMCIGDLKGKDTFTVASKILEQFRTINLTSAYSNVATDLATLMATKLMREKSDKDDTQETPKNVLWSSADSSD
jgi:hypothetical protein